METNKVTLNNGTVLEVGNKYRGGGYSPTQWQEVISIYGEKVLMKDEEGVYDLEFTYYDWLPYTPPTPQKEWKTFLIEIDWNGYTSREIVQFESIEIAKQHYNNAISITEVKLTIKDVK